MAEGILISRAARPSPLRRPPVLISAALAGTTLVTWAVTLERMRGMDAGPGTDLGALGWFIGVWITMMAAMMFPSVAPMVMVFARVSAERRKRGRSFVPTWVFISGYIAAWAAFGFVAYGIFRVIDAAHLHALSWHAQGPLFAGGAIIAAGLYQLSPLKKMCLGHCRSPMHYVMGGWRSGRAGAIRMGVQHGAFCVGCCGGLMVILFVLGVMSIVWMLVIAAVIFAEKVLPFGAWLSRAFAVCFLILGIWVAAAPATVPGLTQPGTTHSMSMRLTGAG